MHTEPALLMSENVLFQFYVSLSHVFLECMRSTSAPVSCPMMMLIGGSHVVSRLLFTINNNNDGK